MTGEIQSLSALPVGAAAIIKGIQGSVATRQRLMELGLVAGTPVEMVRYAPLGDPVEIKIRGSHLTLHRHEADQIQVGVQ